MNSPSFSETLESLYLLNRRGVKLGLNPIKRFLHYLDNPQSKLHIIHVAGTNGKGSTCAFIESILRNSGYNVGLYTSPHLIKFNERIRINNIPIEDAEIVGFMIDSEAIIDHTQSTFFETTTAMAFNYFKKNNVDYAIIETGLGGRLDATNIVDPILTILTPISMDHMDILGGTIEEIASEKAGIIKKGVPVITTRQTDKVMSILNHVAVEKETKILFSQLTKTIETTFDHTHFKIGKNDYKIPLLGNHQTQNASLAVSAVKNILPNIQNHKICNGLEKTSWPGRLQLISKRMYYDVSHNAAGINLTLSTIRSLFPKNNLYGIFCFKKDNNIEIVAKVIDKQFKNIFTINDNRGYLIHSVDLSKKLKNFNIESKPLESIQSGINIIKKLNDESGITLIFGSHYIAEDILNISELSFDSAPI